jgi:hypothetical protein
MEILQNSALNYLVCGISGVDAEVKKVKFRVTFFLLDRLTSASRFLWKVNFRVMFFFARLTSASRFLFLNFAAAKRRPIFALFGVVLSNEAGRYAPTASIAQNHPKKGQISAMWHYS